MERELVDINGGDSVEYILMTRVVREFVNLLVRLYGYGAATARGVENLVVLRIDSVPREYTRNPGGV